MLVTISGTGVKKGTTWVTGLKEPAPVWKDPVPLLGRQIDTSSSVPHSLKLGVQGEPLPQVVVPLICQPPMTRFSARPAPPPKGWPRPKGSAYTTLFTHTWLRTWSLGP
jgi:hypothetical protein